MFSFKRIGSKHLKNSDHLSSIANIAGSVINGISRFITGYLFIKHGYFVSASTIAIIQLISSLTFMLVVESQSSYLYVISIAIFYYSFGGNFGLYPLVTNFIFEKKGALYYSMMISAMVFAGYFTHIFIVKYVWYWIDNHKYIFWGYSVIIGLT